MNLKLKGQRKINKIECRIIHLLIYILCVLLSNFLGLFELDTMKWDIMDLTYPNNMFLSNALKNGILPLWNPIFSYGLPHYANVGMPVFYPTTIILSLFGYRLWMVTAEYCIHVILACYGMNRYIAYSLKDKEDLFSSQLISLFTGLLYGFSGVFLSNAQHMMIIISAAWLPWIFLNIRKAILLEKKKYLLYAAAATGLSVQGGYPELWVGGILITIPYMLLHIEKKKIIKRIEAFIKYYSLYGIFVVMASAITVLPTVVLMPHMQRLNGSSSVQVYCYEWYLFLSSLVPRWGAYVVEKNNDISMICAYVGIFTIALIPLVVFTRWDRKKYFLMGICVFSGLMMFGEKTPLHPLFQKIVPMFSSFRFPSLYRCIIALFLLELIADIWYSIFKGEKRVIKNTLILFVHMDIFMILLQILFREGMKRGEIKLTNEIHICCVILILIISCMCTVITLYYKGYFSRKKSCRLITVLIFVEVFAFFCMEYPVTVGYVRIGKDMISDIRERKDYIFDIDEKNRTREQSVDYRYAIRGHGWDNIINSTEIVLSNELSEVGYTQVKLDSVMNYRTTANRYIVQNNPVFYLTDNLVSSKDVILEEWINDWGVDSRQIYVDNISENINTIEKNARNVIENGEIVNSKLLDIVWSKQGGRVYFENLGIAKSSQNNCKWKIYISDERIIGEEMELIFYKNEEDIQKIIYKISNIYKDENGTFIYGCFPSYDTYQYMDIELDNADMIVQAVEYIEYSNQKVGSNIQVSEFSPNYIELQIQEDKDSCLVTLQTDYPGWRAYVDGVEQEIVTVNGVFRGVFLKAGTHSVEFKFVPIDFYIGIIVTCMFYLYIGIYSLLQIRNIFMIRKCICENE